MGMSTRNFHYYMKKGSGPPVHFVGNRKMYITDEVTKWNNGLRRRAKKGRK